MKQLAAVGFKPDQKTGAARIFDKSANLGYSPDYADSFILTFMGKDRNIKSNIALRMKKMFKPTSDRAVTWGSL
jgi:hypothetical protein